MSNNSKDKQFALKSTIMGLSPIFMVSPIWRSVQARCIGFMSRSPCNQEVVSWQRIHQNDFRNEDQVKMDFLELKNSARFWSVHSQLFLSDRRRGRRWQSIDISRVPDFKPWNVIYPVVKILLLRWTIRSPFKSEVANICSRLSSALAFIRLYIADPLSSPPGRLDDAARTGSGDLQLDTRLERIEPLVWCIWKLYP